MNEATVLTKVGEGTARLAGQVVRAVRRAPTPTGATELRWDLAQRIAPPRRRHRSPWVVGALVLAGGAAAVVAWLRPVGPPPAAAPPRVGDRTTVPAPEDGGRPPTRQPSESE